MSEVFVSYARATLSQAQSVADRLRASGYQVWLDEDLPAHRAYTEVIEERLRAAKAVIVVWSAEAVRSQWVRAEADFARRQGTLVQLTIDGALPPMPFDQIHCEDVGDGIGAAGSAGWARIMGSVAELTGGPVSVGRAEQQAAPRRTPSICVLPFLNMSGDAEQEYFSDGISEDIITDLSKVSALSVVARNSAFAFKGQNLDVREVARHLNVSHVLEGSVRKAGGRVRISAQLIDGVRNDHVWAERYDRELTDIFALQDEITQAIVHALKLKLLPAERRDIERRGTSDLGAYDLYLRGTRPAFTADDLQARIGLLEAATRAAPDYADAWGALANTRSTWAFYRPYRERAEVARLVAIETDRAFELEPQNPAALWASLNLLPPFGGFVEREMLIDRIGKHASRHSRSVYLHSAHLSNVGRIREAIEVAERAFAMDPIDPAVANWLGLMLFAGGRYAQARACFESALARWPDSHYVATNLVLVCVQTRDWTTIESLLAPDRLARFPLRESDQAIRGYAAIMRDRSPQSQRRSIDSARRRLAAFGTADFLQLQLAAESGFAGEAHDIAARASFGPAGNDRDLLGTDAYRPGPLFYYHAPQFRRDPQFINVCMRLGLVNYWLTTQHWPDCVDEVAPHYDFKLQCEKVASGPPVPFANDAGFFKPALPPA
jgi:adenylate cyclase